MDWGSLMEVGLWLIFQAKRLAEADGLTPAEFDSAVASARVMREDTVKLQRAKEWPQG